MEVTSENFKETLPHIEKVISRATFLAIDCEFSGLNVVSEINAYDTPKQYYEKVRKNCKDFLVLQYGISAFRYDSDAGRFMQQSYNFYIFRRPVNRIVPDQRFLCQTSSINFLTSQGFDFNKLFKSGISYLNISEEESYRGKLEEQQRVRSNQQQQQHNSGNDVPVPEDMQEFVDDILKQIEEFLDSDHDEIELPKCNAFMRRLIYQTTAQKYGNKNKIVVQSRQNKNKDRVLVVSRFKSKKEQDEIEQKIVEDELSTLDDFIGFTKVLRLIIDCGKLVVGHNMCLDLLHTIDKFLTPLPEDYDSFKECVSSLFAKVLDTKHLASSEDLRDLVPSTVLKELLDTVSKDPFDIPPNEIEPNGQGYKVEDLKEHEAGYDAFITGLSFISLWGRLGLHQNFKFDETFKNFDLLEPFINKLYLMILRDNQHINLDGSDPDPSRDHVFYLKFPKEWKLNNIIELFSPFGGVYVAWINESSAYIGLFKRDQATVVLNTLSQSDTYSIMTYKKRQAMLSEHNNSFGYSSSSLSSSRKRSSDTKSRCNANKRMKIDTPGSSRVESESKVGSKRTSKAFMESDTWE